MTNISSIANTKSKPSRRLHGFRLGDRTDTYVVKWNSGQSAYSPYSGVEAYAAPDLIMASHPVSMAVATSAATMGMTRWSAADVNPIGFREFYQAVAEALLSQVSSLSDDLSDMAADLTARHMAQRRYLLRFDKPLAVPAGLPIDLLCSDGAYDAPPAASGSVKGSATTMGDVTICMSYPVGDWLRTYPTWIPGASSHSATSFTWKFRLPSSKIKLMSPDPIPFYAMNGAGYLLSDSWAYELELLLQVGTPGASTPAIRVPDVCAYSVMRPGAGQCLLALPSLTCFRLLSAPTDVATEIMKASESLSGMSDYATAPYKLLIFETNDSAASSLSGLETLPILISLRSGLPNGAMAPVMTIPMMDQSSGLISWNDLAAINGNYADEVPEGYEDVIANAGNYRAAAECIIHDGNVVALHTYSAAGGVFSEDTVVS